MTEFDSYIYVEPQQNARKHGYFIMLYYCIKCTKITNKAYDTQVSEI
jgi:hypothetical protein